MGAAVIERRLWKKRAASAVTVLAIALALSACGGGGQGAIGSGNGGEVGGNGGANGGQATAGPLAQASEPVQALFKANCQSCHGVDLTGRAGPVTNLQHVGGKLTQERIAAQITNGGGNMPAFGTRLKPDEIAALASWLAGVK